MLSQEQKSRQAKVLDIDEILAEARSRAGLRDFGNDDFLEPLRQLLKCAAEDVDFHEDGLEDARETTIRDLVNRLRIEDDLKRHPEILDEDVSDPIVLLGLPRCGTTKTHRSIGSDPRLLKTFMWQLINPARFPDAAAGQPDPRIAAALGQDPLLADNPEIRAAHLYGINEIQSDLFLFGLTFNEPTYLQARMRSPSFHEWIMQRTHPSSMDNYAYVKKVVQYLQWQQGGREGRRWLLKNEAAVGDLDALLAAYPQATLVHLHRDPRVCVPSAISLGKNYLELRAGNVDVKDIARYTLDRTKRTLAAHMDVDRRAKRTPLAG